jgi:pimeloyl-ACP methyl ester carboxylesterase
VASLTVLSRPHPNAFNRALQVTDSEQAQRSRHHKAFLEPDAADVVLADDAKWLRERLAANGVPADAIARHLAVLGNKEAMEAALAWYRARGAIRGPLGPIRVPTLYIWGDADDTVGRTAAEGTVDFVAAPYRFEVLPGVGHFAADQAPDRVSELLLAQVASHPA